MDRKAPTDRLDVTRAAGHTAQGRGARRNRHHAPCPRHHERSLQVRHCDRQCRDKSSRRFRDRAQDRGQRPPTRRCWPHTLCGDVAWCRCLWRQPHHQSCAAYPRVDLPVPQRGYWNGMVRIGFWRGAVVDTDSQIEAAFGWQSQWPASCCATVHAGHGRAQGFTATDWWWPPGIPQRAGAGPHHIWKHCTAGAAQHGHSDHVPHGFRASIRTMAREYLHFDKEVIERLLSHGSREELGGAYDRTQFMKEHIRLVQAWADYLDVLRVGGNVVQLKVA